MSTTISRLHATTFETPAPNHRDTFARQAALDAFGPQSRWTLDDPSFLDRAPNDGPRPIGKVAAKVTNETGVKALRHWLVEAAQASTDEERAAALEIAAEIARLAGIPWVDPTGQRAA